MSDDSAKPGQGRIFTRNVTGLTYAECMDAFYQEQRRSLREEGKTDVEIDALLATPEFLAAAHAREQYCLATTRR